VTQQQQPVYENVAVIGAGGAIGGAFIELLKNRHGTRHIHAFSRTARADASPPVVSHPLDYEDETSIERAAMLAASHGPLHLVLATVGILHDGELMPEKSLRDLSAEKFQRLFMANTIVPALLAKYFLPRLDKDARSVFAALSARVGSISDNRIGGWYAYRASKAALNMVIKNAALETGRRCKQAVVVGLHPGTVDSALSKPFQRSVPQGKLFPPEYAAARLMQVLDRLTPTAGGKCFAWDGQEVEP